METQGRGTEGRENLGLTKVGQEIQAMINILYCSIICKIEVGIKSEQFVQLNLKLKRVS